MRTSRWVRPLILLLATFADLATAGRSAADPVSFPQTAISFTTPGGPRCIEVEYASTRTEIMTGYRGRPSLDPDGGILFALPSAGWGFTMDEVHFPLDVLFLSKEGRVFEIHDHLSPGSRQVIRPSQPMAANLALHDGAVARWGIHVGDYVRHPFFGSPEQDCAAPGS